MLKLLIATFLVITLISLFYAFFYLIKNPNTQNRVLKPLAIRVFASVVVLGLAFLQLSNQA